MERMLAENLQCTALVDKYLHEQMETVKLAARSYNDDENLIKEEVKKQQEQQRFLVRQVLQEVCTRVAVH